MSHPNSIIQTALVMAPRSANFSALLLSADVYRRLQSLSVEEDMTEEWEENNKDK